MILSILSGQGSRALVRIDSPDNRAKVSKLSGCPDKPNTQRKEGFKWLGKAKRNTARSVKQWRGTTSAPIAGMHIAFLFVARSIARYSQTSRACRAVSNGGMEMEFTYQGVTHRIGTAAFIGVLGGMVLWVITIGF
jgi:hypothetical protein